MAGNPNPKISNVYAGLTVHRPGEGVKWLGEVREVPERLDWPCRWRKPRRILVSSHGDLFHPAVDPMFIRRALLTMLACNQHSYIVLTKFPRNMRREVADYIAAMGPAKDLLGLMESADGWKLPPHMIMCATAENQEHLEGRWSWLASVPAMRRGLSLEPILGPIDLGRAVAADWIVVGGESGTQARPCHPVWVRSIRDQCRAAGVPLYFKQWGEYAPADQIRGVLAAEGITHYSRYVFPEDGALPSQQVFRVGKHHAGNLLDGERYAMLPGDTWPEEV